MRSKFAGLAAYLSGRLGVNVEVVPGSDLTNTVSELGAGKIDIAYLSPTTYVEARHKFGADVIVKALSGGKPFTHSAIVTRDGAGINNIKDIMGRRFAFGDEKSTTSHLMPRAMLYAAGIKLQDLKDYRYLGRHDSVADSVIGGEFDAGGLMESVARNYEQKGLKVLKLSGDIPTFNIVGGSNLDPATGLKIKEALVAMSMSNSDQAKALRDIDPLYDGFAEASDSDYDEIRRMVKQLYGITYS
jgi:phosphonate transport system substrate-binding protein